MGLLPVTHSVCVVAQALPLLLTPFCAAVPLSIDHKPNSKEERQRIENAGGVVVWAGTWRVGGVLAVSRAFGDRPLKRFVIPTPDIKQEQLTSDDEFIILASDGLWDVVSNQVGATATLITLITPGRGLPYRSDLGLSRCLGPGECLHSFIHHPLRRLKSSNKPLRN